MTQPQIPPPKKVIEKPVELSTLFLLQLLTQVLCKSSRFAGMMHLQCDRHQILNPQEPPFDL